LTQTITSTLVGIRAHHDMALRIAPERRVEDELRATPNPYALAWSAIHTTGAAATRARWLSSMRISSGNRTKNQSVNIPNVFFQRLFVVKKYEALPQAKASERN